MLLDLIVTSVKECVMLFLELLNENSVSKSLATCFANKRK